jgi:integrase
MTYNDYQKFRLPGAENKQIRYLTDEELKLLTEKELPLQRLNNIRDVFLFQCYTGLAYVDVQKLTPQDIKVENGDKWIITERVKTGTISEIFLLPEALKLIDRHKGGEMLFPVPCNQKMKWKN